MNFPAELHYTKSHEWVKFTDENTAWWASPISRNRSWAA
jgi:glycine cleavage system H lipoate-binding protein